MKILAISDVPSKALWDYCTREKLAGVDIILSCGDLPKKYLEYLTNFTAAPILYVHGNHDGSYKGDEPGGCICVDDEVYIWKGLRIMGLGGCIRYNREDTYQYTEKEMRRRARKLWFKASISHGLFIFFIVTYKRGWIIGRILLKTERVFDKINITQNQNTCNRKTKICSIK